MDNINESGRIEPIGGPAPAAAVELQTTDLNVALLAVLRFRIVASWLGEAGGEASWLGEAGGEAAAA